MSSNYPSSTTKIPRNVYNPTNEESKFVTKVGISKRGEGGLKKFKIITKKSSVFGWLINIFREKKPLWKKSKPITFYVLTPQIKLPGAF